MQVYSRFASFLYSCFSSMDRCFSARRIWNSAKQFSHLLAFALHFLSFRSAKAKRWENCSAGSGISFDKEWDSFYFIKAIMRRCCWDVNLQMEISIMKNTN